MPFIEHPPTRKCETLILPYCCFDLFSPEHCDKIINHCLNKWKAKQGLIGGKGDVKGIREDLNYRNALCMHSPYMYGSGSDFENHFIKKIVTQIIEHNDSPHGYGFDICGPLESPMFLIYNEAKNNPDKKPGQYKFHIDINVTYPESNRKIGYSLLLNHGEYEGGDLVTKIDESEQKLNPSGAPVNKGTLVVFPSYLLHKVTSITKGTRYSLTGWVHGDSFK